MRCSPPRLVKIPFSSVMDHGFTWMLCLIQDGILFCFLPVYSAAYHACIFTGAFICGMWLADLRNFVILIRQNEIMYCVSFRSSLKSTPVLQKCVYSVIT